MQRSGMRRMSVFLALPLVASVAGCAELKVGVGPFKAASVEAGPGGVEAKGPSAGPLKTTGAEIGPGGADEEE